MGMHRVAMWAKSCSRTRTLSNCGFSFGTNSITHYEKCICTHAHTMIAGTLQKTDTAGLENFHRRYPKHSKILIRIWTSHGGGPASEAQQKTASKAPSTSASGGNRRHVSKRIYRTRSHVLQMTGIPWWQPEDIISEVRAGPESGVPQQAAAIATTW